MSLTYNEQTKLLANALDRASTACFTVGIVTPLAGSCALLHWGARRILRGLKP